jgi:N-acylneuraminate cytidylyltransferase
VTPAGRSRTVALVPAKATSRRVPGKNLTSLAGMPLFGHSVRVARAVSRIDTVLVSSDSAELLSLAERYGATPVPRPPELCADDVPNFEVLRHCVSWLRARGDSPELLVLLQPTTPFRTPGPLDDMIARVDADSSADSLITVAAITRLTGDVRDGCWTTVGKPDSVRRARGGAVQQGISGHVYILRPARTLDLGLLLGERVLAEALPETWLDVDIDNPNDLLIAECVAERFFQQRFP